MDLQGRIQLSHKNILILGATFDTGNLGVSALAWSAINLLFIKWPDADVNLLGGRSKSKQPVTIKGSSIEIPSWALRYSPKLFIANHIVWMLLTVGLIKLFPFLKKILVKKGSTLEAVYKADVFADITGGDSFSDIYGMKRLVMGYMVKRLCQMTGKPFFMLPQTYGPFKSPVSRFLAGRVLKKAVRIYSRDKEGMSVVKGLIGDTDKVAISPDVAFVLAPKAPERSVISDHQLADLLFGGNKKQVIGLNVSGLLYNGGYTGNNEFGLKCSYRDLIKELVSYFCSFPDTYVMLIPHVVPELFEVENDLTACHQVRDNLGADLQGKVIIAEPQGRDPFFDQCEIKHIIGKCDFFLGSRMHATIAAISQCIPTVGLAYSKKFAGVYETVGVDDCVVDLRELDNSHIMESVKSIFEKRDEIKQRLEENIPIAKQKVSQLFDNL